MINDIHHFELEDRKTIQSIVTMLFDKAKKEISEIIGGKVGTGIILSLLSLTQKDYVHFAANYMRMYTDSDYLISSWFDIEAIKTLLFEMKECGFDT